MSYEVELKFPVENPDEVVQRILAAGAVRRETHRQCDRYFNHPSRDFGETDEAFRIRTNDGEHCVTYKGPKVDATTKTRREIEIPIGASEEDEERFAEILKALGFRETGAVRKTRDYYDLTRDGREYECCVDDVDGLGMFIELETAADDAGLDDARDRLQQLARELGLENSERRSYLVLLLEQEYRS